MSGRVTFLTRDALLPWNDSFLVGHLKIDGQHRELVALINRISCVLQRRLHDELEALLGSLTLVVREHIREEDTVLREIRDGAYRPLNKCPKTAAYMQAMANSALVKRGAERESLWAGFEDTIRSPIETLSEELRDWFIHHAIKQDSELKAIFQAVGACSGSAAGTGWPHFVSPE